MHPAGWLQPFAGCLAAYRTGCAAGRQPAKASQLRHNSGYPVYQVLRSADSFIRCSRVWVNVQHQQLCIQGRRSIFVRAICPVWPR